ncbi:pilus assembly protein TadG-related protein [Streptomyces sp. NPDC059909]|uniref:pilus assembly protein TadG-related protein n=1 Tax=Streptomyces sp. NPDC059909 TaxID=3346998 RepID=UPI00364BED80
MLASRRSDRGQAFPIYIMMVAGLLFLALAFFAVGKASATRNGAQGAADAAALAAAQEARDQMGPGFLAALLLPGGLDDFFEGNHFGPGAPCNRAQYFAAENRADVVTGGCQWDSGFKRDEVTVEVKTRYTVGDSVIPGTETRHATAKATAVVEFRCSWKPADKEGKPGNGGDPDKDKEKDKPGPIEFKCDGRDSFKLDPLDLDPWEELAEVFFAVHLVD